eukprot:scaffold1045_cov186-Alexandrium_tamarense.AAC.5
MDVFCCKTCTKSTKHVSCKQGTVGNMWNFLHHGDARKDLGIVEPRDRGIISSVSSKGMPTHVKKSSVYNVNITQSAA